MLHAGPSRGSHEILRGDVITLGAAGEMQHGVHTVECPLESSASRERDCHVSAGRALVEAWLSAVQEGDLEGLVSLLHEDATLHADYGTSTQTLHGADEIAAQAVLAARLAAHSTPVIIDGRPGVAAMFGDRAVSLMVFEVADDRIVGLEVLADPERLTGTSQ